MDVRLELIEADLVEELQEVVDGLEADGLVVVEEGVVEEDVLEVEVAVPAGIIE